MYHSTDFSFNDLKISDITEDILKECSILFSNYYGVWKDGTRVKMGVKTLRKNCLFDENCRLVIAKINGHSFYIFKDKIIWITQLVIHPDYRNNKLLKHCLIHDWKYCGVATSHPYVIKSLEGASSYLIVPNMIRKYAKYILDEVKIPYLSSDRIVDLTIDSNFNVDHTEILSLINEWRLGKLKDGHEFLGVIVR